MNVIVISRTNRCHLKLRLFSRHHGHHQKAECEITDYENRKYHCVRHRNPRPIESMISWTLLSITILEEAFVSALRSSLSSSSSRVSCSKSLSAIFNPSFFVIERERIRSLPLDTKTEQTIGPVKNLNVRLRRIHNFDTNRGGAKGHKIGNYRGLSVP